MATNFWLFYSHILVSVTLVEKGRGKGQVTVLEFYTPCNISTTAKARDFKFCTQVGQFLHCGLAKFSHRKLSVYTWYPQFDRRRFVYDTYRTMKATRSRHGWVHMFITHHPTAILQLHNFDLFRTCRTSSFCTVSWSLRRFQLTRRIARSPGDSWASCQNSFTVRLSGKFATSLHLNIPPHLNYVATLPCEISMFK